MGVFELRQAPMVTLWLNLVRLGARPSDYPGYFDTTDGVKPHGNPPQGARD